MCEISHRYFTNRAPALACGALLALFAAAGAQPPAGAGQAPRATLERLRRDYSLDAVARSHVEVGFDDLRGLAQPLTQRTAIQVKNHPDVVFVHPDMSITLGTEDDAYVLGFALGTPPRLPGIYETTRELQKGYQPIVTSRLRSGGLTLEQVAFGVLPADKAVVSGTEKQDVMIRIRVANDTGVAVSTALSLLVGVADGSQCENLGYTAFRAPVSRWQHDKLQVTADRHALAVNGRVLLTYRENAATPASLLRSLEVAAAHILPLERGGREWEDATLFASASSAGDDHPHLTSPFKGEEPIHVDNALRFDLRLKPHETRVIDFTCSGSSRLYPDTERTRMAAVSYERALRKAEAAWDAALEPGMKLVTPESRLNDVYRKLILSCLQNLPKEPNTSWVVPVHCSGYPGGIWCWEFAHVAAPLDSLGFHKDMEACLRWFTDHQSGVGKFGDVKEGPEGEVTSNVGCFVGAGAPRWMCETGCVLWMLGDHYRYSRDAAWLKANRDSVLAAWRWIQSQRDNTRVRDAAGNPVTQYGLLPKGRSSDWPGHLCYYCWSDGYTYKGMAETAAALREAGDPDAARLFAETDEYKRCILDTLGRVTYKDPETGLLLAPDTASWKPGENPSAGIWASDGPRALFDVGILSPLTDAKYWEPDLALTLRRWGFLAGLTFHFNYNENPDLWTVPRDSPFWYVFATDVSWHRDFLARGEVEKALLLLYSPLVYGMSNDCYETVERVDLNDPNYAPLSPNSSSSGRALEMIRRTVIDEQDTAQGKLWLLRGCPRRWFAPGKSIRVSDAPTVFGKLSMRTAGRNGEVVVDVDPPKDPALKQLCIAVHIPIGRKVTKTTVNGVTWTTEADSVTVLSPQSRLRIVVEYE